MTPQPGDERLTVPSLASTLASINWTALVHDDIGVFVDLRKQFDQWRRHQLLTLTSQRIRRNANMLYAPRGREPRRSKRDASRYRFSASYRAKQAKVCTACEGTGDQPGAAAPGGKDCEACRGYGYIIRRRGDVHQ